MSFLRLSTIDKFVIAATSVVGLLALVAWRSPDVVAFSSFVGLPYLILAPAPTAFLYVGIFAVAWFSIGRWSRLLGLGVGAAAIWLVAFQLPEQLNQQFAAEDRALAANDRASSRPADPGDVIALVTQLERYPDDPDLQNVCDFLCEAILYSDSARGVVMARSGDAAGPPKLWRVARQDRLCDLPRGGQSVLRINHGASDLSGRIESRALNGDCLMSGPSNLAAAQTLVEHRFIGSDEPTGEYGLALRPAATGGRITVSQRLPDGRVGLLARRTVLYPRKLDVPLRLTIGGSPNSGATWLWARESGAPSDYLAVDSYLKLKIASLPAPTPSDLRAAVDRWLALPDKQSTPIDRTLTEQFYKMVDRGGGEPSDVQRTVAILLDPRTDSPRQSWMVKQKFPDSVPLLFDATLARMTREPADSRALISFDESLDQYPDAMFRALDPRLAAMLRDPSRRGSMRKAISLLGKAGPSAAPLLLAILRDSVETKPEPNIHVATAALSGLCRLGPTIKPAYTQIEEIVSRNAFVARSLRGTGYGSYTYSVTLLRTGKPLSQMTKPETTGSSWQENLQRDADGAECQAR